MCKSPGECCYWWELSGWYLIRRYYNAATWYHCITYLHILYILNYFVRLRTSNDHTNQEIEQFHCTDRSVNQNLSAQIRNVMHVIQSWIRDRYKIEPVQICFILTSTHNCACHSEITFAHHYWWCDLMSSSSALLLHSLLTFHPLASLFVSFRRPSGGLPLRLFVKPEALLE